MKGTHVLPAIGLILAVGSAGAQSGEAGPASERAQAEAPPAERRLLDEADRLNQEAFRLYSMGDYAKAEP